LLLSGIARTPHHAGNAKGAVGKRKASDGWYWWALHEINGHASNGHLDLARLPTKVLSKLLLLLKAAKVANKNGPRAARALTGAAV
jgi:hypothetical protein